MDEQKPLGTANASVPPPPESRKPRTFGLAVVILAAVAGIAVGALGGIVLTDGGDGTADGDSTSAGAEPADISLDSTRFELAYEACGGATALEPYLQVADEGTSIVIDGPSDESAGLTDAITGTFCVLEELEVPTFVTTQIENTTSLMGRQEASWDGIEASWSYHPDNGLDLVLVDQG
jgi:hypothetical protein